jgi:hypothetical protein
MPLMYSPKTDVPFKITIEYVDKSILDFDPMVILILRGTQGRHGGDI